MEAQVDPHNAGMHSGEGEEGEQQHHHKSVLKKVKEKAKKIKNTITKHGQAHDHDNDEDDDEETMNDHEVHGAPMCESTVTRSVNLPKESNTNLEKPTDTREDRYDDNASTRNRGINTPFAPKGQTSPQVGMGNRNVGEPKAKIEPLLGLEEDPHSPGNSPSSENITPSNYQSKAADPTRAGSKEEEVAPLVRQFDNLNVGDEPASKKTEPEQRSYTGSHDQFAPQPTPTKSQFNPESTNQETNTTSGEPSTISEKNSSTTSAIADKALSAKNVIASKLGYGGATADKKPVSESATEYAHMVAEKLTPVYEKVAGAGSAVMSKVHSGGGGKGEAHRGGDHAVGVLVKGGATSMSEYLADKLRPRDEDKALSEAITGAFSKDKGEGRPWGGKVTVSKEVADRLGPGEESKREGEDAVAAGLESSGQGMVDRLRDAVGLWLGKSTGMQTAQDSVSKSHVSGVGAGTGQDFSGEKRD